MDRELEDKLYEQVAKEVAASNYVPAPMARAIEQSAGNADLAKSLYVKFRIEQLKYGIEQEAILNAERQEQEAKRAAEMRKEKTRQRVTQNFKGCLLLVFIVFAIFVLLLIITVVLSTVPQQ